MECKVAFHDVLRTCLVCFGHEKRGEKHPCRLPREGGQKHHVAHLKHSFLFSKCMRTKSCMEIVCLGHLGKEKKGGAYDGRNLAELFGEKCTKLG